jgi:hypothetical protein
MCQGCQAEGCLPWRACISTGLGRLRTSTTIVLILLNCLPVQVCKCDVGAAATIQHSSLHVSDTLLLVSTSMGHSIRAHDLLIKQAGNTRGMIHHTQTQCTSTHMHDSLLAIPDKVGGVRVRV